METTDSNFSEKLTANVSKSFNYSYVVLVILLLLTIGATTAFFKMSTTLDSASGRLWTPVVFLIGFCVSLLIFGATYREIQARAVLQRKTVDLIRTQKENDELLAAEQASRVRAEEANLAKDEFLAVVSHELRTPLNAIAGWNRILRTRGISDDTKRTAVERIDKNLRLQMDIVEELLNFSDIRSSGMSMERSILPMRGVFDEAVATASVAAFQKGVLLVDENALDGACVLGDRHKLKLAITNVLTNAVKFTPPGGNIEAKAFCDDGVVKFVVEDNGIGIEPDMITHIFDEYRQSEHATTRHYGGLGLGLTIAGYIVKLHNGTIDVESTGIGQGSTFTITIPRTDPTIVH